MAKSRPKQSNTEVAKQVVAPTARYFVPSQSRSVEGLDLKDIRKKLSKKRKAREEGDG